MNSISRELLKTIEKDDSLVPHERDALQKLRRGEVGDSVKPERLLRRREVAERLAVTLRTVDRWCKLGHLPRMQLPGHSRSSGVPETAVASMIANHSRTGVDAVDPTELTA
jgi:predicted DNA-binding transcriptional regulator AlpA